MRTLLLITILAETLFLLVSVWWTLGWSGNSTAPNLDSNSLAKANRVHLSDPMAQAEKENARLRKLWQRSQLANNGANDPNQGMMEVSFNAVLERVSEDYLLSTYSIGTPPVLAGALNLSDEERAEVDEIWQAATNQFKKLELRHTTSANAEIAAESDINMAKSRPKVRAKLEEEGLAADELEARMQEFEQLMAYDESGRLRLHIASSALYENAEPALNSLHASLKSVLRDSPRASLVTEAFANLYLGGKNATETTIDFLFGTDEASVTTHATRLVGTEITPDGQEIPVMSTRETTTSLSLEKVSNRFDHLVDTETQRIQSEVTTKSIPTK